MPHEICGHHIGLANKIEVMANDITYIRDSIEKKDAKLERHVQEGEREGGFRDRVQTLEREVSMMKKERWKLAITAGLACGMAARSPDIWNMISNVLCKLAMAGQ